MLKSHRPLLGVVVALGLAGTALPAFALGAKCPDSSPVLDVTPQFQDGVLRCISRVRAPVACTTPTHPTHQKMPESGVTIRLNNNANLDYCKPMNLVMANPVPAVPVSCPPNMGVVVQNGRDYCRAVSAGQTQPLLIPN